MGMPLVVKYVVYAIAFLPRTPLTPAYEFSIVAMQLISNVKVQRMERQGVAPPLDALFACLTRNCRDQETNQSLQRMV